MTEEEKSEMELNIEAKYVGRTEKEFLNNITFAECLYILDTKNNYCDEIKGLSLLKLVDIISKLQADIEIKDKVINYIAKHTYIRTGENGVLGTITEEVIEHLYKKVEEENVKD